MLRYFLTLLFLLGLVPSAWALPVFSINGSGNIFTVQGEGLEGVTALDLLISYDPATLTNPHVVLQTLFAGSIMQPNTTTAGVARIVLLQMNPQGVSGSGGVITITFDKIGVYPGHIISFSAKAVIKGVEMDLQTVDATTYQSSAASTASPGSNVSTPTQSSTVASTSQGSSSTTASASLPTATAVTAPLSRAVTTSGTGGGLTGSSQEISVKSPLGQNEAGRALQEGPPPAGPMETDTSQGGGSPPPEPLTPLDMPALKPVKAVEQKTTEFKSVLSLFRDFKGTRSPDKLVALFAQASYSGVKQTPEIVLADGKNKLKVSFETSEPITHAPNYSIIGGKLVSLSTLPGTYVFEILPEQNVTDASVTILVKNETFVIPLTVAPPLRATFMSGGKLDEASYALFLQEKNPVKSDVNGDGVRDYVDEYIYAANYLVLRSRGEQKDLKAGSAK